ncbi:Obg family GTPase CgtA, partial [Chloroflexota bacterium]
VQTQIDSITAPFHTRGIRVHVVSALTGEGVPELMAETLRRLSILKASLFEAEETDQSKKVFRPQPREQRVEITQEDGVFVIKSLELERLYTRGSQAGVDAVWHLKRYLTRIGVGKQLAKAGIQPGDPVRCGTFTWKW